MSIASRIDWNKFQKLGLDSKVLASLRNLRQRNEIARSHLESLKELDKPVDFAYYKSILKNQKILNEIEQKVKNFKPQTYDVGAQINVIKAFEQKAMTNAQNTNKAVSEELAKLNETLQNIESAASFDQITVEDVAKCDPDIDNKLVEMVNKGRFVVPGYKEKFGDYTIM